MSLEELADDHDSAHIDAAILRTKDFTLAVDGGSHRGIFTRKLAAKFERVLAFEPMLSNFCAAPRLPNVTYYDMALGDKTGVVKLAHGTENTGQAHISGEGHAAMMTPLDKLALDACGLLKLDVEGYELFALQGAEETLKTYKPTVMIEENGLCERYGVHPGDAQRFLEGLGYAMTCAIGRDLIFEHRSR